MKPIPYGRQTINEEDIQSVIDVLRSDYLTTGPTISRFEESVAAYCEVKHAVAVSSATAALHLACLSLDLGPNDVLWTSTNTFVASANCAIYCGATVDFVDIDPNTYNISVSALKFKLEQTQRAGGRLPKIVIPVHFSGQSCEMDEIGKLALQYGFKVVEDASHAIGAKYRGDPVGNCRFSDMAVFSLHPVKIITTGEGGIITTNDSALYRRLCRLRSHGITRDSAELTEPSHGNWYYQQIELGYNYRLTDIQAALGLSQLKRLDEFVEGRHKLADFYDQNLRELPVVLPTRVSHAFSSFHLYVIRLRLDRIRATQREVFERMHTKGVLVNLHYIPVHLQPYYQNLGFHRGQFPESEKYYSEAMTLPIYPGLSDSKQRFIVDCLRSSLEQC